MFFVRFFQLKVLFNVSGNKWDTLHDLKFGLHDGDKFLVALLRHHFFQLFVADVGHEFVAPFQNVDKPERGHMNQEDFDKNCYGFSIITKIAKKSCEFF